MGCRAAVQEMKLAIWKTTVVNIVIIWWTVGVGVRMGVTVMLTLLIRGKLGTIDKPVLKYRKAFYRKDKRKR